MDQIHAGREFICSTSGTKSAECPVAKWLLLEAGCMQCVLETQVELTGFQDLVIRQSGKFFDDEGTDNDIDWRVRSGIGFSLKRGANISSSIFLKI